MLGAGRENDMSLFSELKRRNVFRVALLYVVASWIILQVADLGISLLGLPVSSGRLVFLLLAAGLPLVLVFSWVYEITPEGLKKEKDIDRSKSVTDQTARKLDAAVIVLLVIGLGALGLDRLVPERAADFVETDAATGAAAAVPEKSIAVLPFVNISADQDNEYFSDGLSEELLNLLAKIPELQVAARTSAFRFKNSNASINDIAEQLNVAHVLEGSVRKSGNEIRITAQLIKASDGYHLWSHTWDRTLHDVFAIQDEIAAAVVAALRISLLGEMPKVRSTDPRAYELYLQSRRAANLHSKEGLEQSVALLTEALAIDPDYADAWTELSRTHTNMTGSAFVLPADGYPRAEAAALRALAIDPQSARALSNLGWLAMYWEWDMPKAAMLIRQAKALEPGNASILNAYAVLNFAFARGDAGISIYKEALNLDPLAISVLANLTGTYLNENRLDDAAELVERIRQVEPQSTWVPVMSGWVENLRGNSETALEYFAEAPDGPSAWGRAITHYDLGQDAASDAALEELKEVAGYEIQVATVYAYRKHIDEAFEWLDRAYESHDGSMIEIRMYKVLFAPLHDDPRWHALVEKLGLSDEVATTIGL
jgi:TolB-like protein/Flp pilus assembly protein TadD